MVGRSWVAALVAGLLAATAAPAAAAPAADAREVIGTSREGRPIVARHYGAPDAPVQLLVLGQMHGTEPGGRRVVAQLSGLAPGESVGLWVISTMNPDGADAGTRANARGVDLNRNFPANWRKRPRTGWGWSGPRASSEPETRAMMAFLERVRPTALISFHQALDVVDITHPRARAAGRELARLMGERASVVRCHGPCTGTLTQWASAHLDTISITVELDGRVSAGESRRAARAVLRLGDWLAGRP